MRRRPWRACGASGRSSYAARSVFTSPIGRGRHEVPGEGLSSNDRPYPLTPALSHRKSGLPDLRTFMMRNRGRPRLRWEREHTVTVIAALFELNLIAPYADG